jgi:hypothetical protein
VAIHQPAHRNRVGPAIGTRPVLAVLGRGDHRPGFYGRYREAVSAAYFTNELGAVCSSQATPSTAVTTVV